MAASENSRSQSTTCCIVGGGPGGVVLALLLARKGVPVTLLEAHKDFDRDFRGDTVHPAILELMDQLGLAERLLQIRHTKMERVVLRTPAGEFQVATFERLKSRFPYIAMIPQTDFLDFLASEAQKYPSFRLVMGASADEIIEEDGMVKGVRYRGEGGSIHEVRALLTVGADGRFSKMRKLGGFTAIKTSPPMDVTWFRVPGKSTDAPGVMATFGHGHLLIMLNRDDVWQIGLVIVKGSFKEMREKGIEAFRRSVAEMAPHMADRLAAITDWKQVSLLSVEADRVKKWHRPGLLLIGDAAHVMSPVGGNGINYAVQDAVAAANVLTGPLLAGKISDGDLAKVQRQRELPVRIIQTIVTALQDNVIKSALDPGRPPLEIPSFLKWPLLRDIPANVVGFGIMRTKLKD